MFKKIQQWDLNFVHSFSQNTWIRQNEKMLKFFTRMGDGWVWALVVLILWGTYDLSEFFVFLKYGFGAGLLSLILYWIVKLSVRRQRPFKADPSLKAEVPPMDQYSFPSGHTMNNMAVGFAFCWLNVGVGIPLILTALAWGILRVYFKVHYLTDILCGAFLAIPCALLVPMLLSLLPI